MSYQRAPRLLQDGLVYGAASHPDKALLTTESGTYTYGDLHDAALSVARRLQDRRLVRGDRVVIFMENTAECAIAFYATLLAGAVAIVINPQTKHEKLAYVLRDSEASVLIAGASLLETARSAARVARSVHTIVGSGRSNGDAEDGSHVDLHEAIATADPAAVAPAQTIPLDLAALIYTSGSTGEPKGVMMTHQSMVFAAGSIIEYLRLTADDRIMNVLPLAFDYGLYQLIMAVQLGATLVLERSFAFPSKTLERIDTEAVTVFPGVPTVFATLLALRQRNPHSSVTRVTNTAAALPPTFHEGLHELFPNALIFRMYGLTECILVS